MTRTRTHTHAWPEDDVDCVDVGDEVCLFPIRSQDPGVRGFWIGHDVPDGGPRCVGRVPTEGEPSWSQTGTLEGGDLTLEPSIRCIGGNGRHVGDFHGWVRDGGWVPA